MPFKSKAQRRLFYVLEAKGKLKKGTARQWDAETGDRKLPERVRSKTAALKRVGLVEKLAEPTPANPPISAFRAGAIGAGNGLTFGFGDELQGVVGAPIRRLAGDPQTPTLGAAYRTVRDEAAEERRQAAAENPGAYASGGVLGGLVGGAAGVTAAGAAGATLRGAGPAIGRAVTRAAAPISAAAMAAAPRLAPYAQPVMEYGDDLMDVAPVMAQTATNAFSTLKNKLTGSVVPTASAATMPPTPPQPAAPAPVAPPATPPVAAAPSATPPPANRVIRVPEMKFPAPTPPASASDLLAAIRPTVERVAKPPAVSEQMASALDNAAPAFGDAPAANALAGTAAKRFGAPPFSPDLPGTP